MPTSNTPIPPKATIKFYGKTLADYYMVSFSFTTPRKTYTLTTQSQQQTTSSFPRRRRPRHQFELPGMLHLPFSVNLALLPLSARSDTATEAHYLIEDSTALFNVCNELLCSALRSHQGVFKACEDWHKLIVELLVLNMAKSKFSKPQDADTPRHAFDFFKVKEVDSEPQEFHHIKLTKLPAINRSQRHHKAQQKLSRPTSSETDSSLAESDFSALSTTR